MNREELKPCPFCGGKAKLIKVDNGYYVQCVDLNCKTRTQTHVRSEAFAVIDIWNRRLSALSAEGEYIKKEDILKELEGTETFYRKRFEKYQDIDPQRAYVARAVANVYKYLILFTSDLPTYSFPEREKGTLEKIRAEINREYLAEGHLTDYWDGIDKCLEIIDKHIGKAESEE